MASKKATVKATVKVPAATKMGCPTKYKPEYCDMLIEHMRGGYSATSFAGVVGVAVSTIWQWVSDNEDFSAAKKRGEALLELFYIKMGMDLARGMYTNGNATAWIYLTKNLIKWTDRTDLKITGDFFTNSEAKKDHDLLQAVDRKDLIRLVKKQAG